ncbi:1,2-phenylacetyl-CoA epoxidase subunit PaaE [Bizionia sediminis]|uniref:1,2-phenylacetyl-CoA epoxidase subunit PaaE n=1 Tax=Bizionia sediminis TaxID=1737064 RepID=A0ABW5KU92_9FLAO
MADFYNVAVADIYKETTDTVVISLDVPENLKETFQFKQGQHVTLRTQINGADIRRNYSLCTSPMDNQWRIAVKAIPGGVFSNYAFNTLKKGDVLGVMPPHGEFYVDCQPEVAKNYIAFAAGSGITPMLSIIKTHLQSEPNSTFKLFYLNKTVKSIIFKEEIEHLKNVFLGRFQVFYFLTKEQRDIPFLNGRFDKEKLAVLTNRFVNVADTHHAFICGPQEMIFLIRDELQAAGMPKEAIHYELFYSGSTAEKSKHIAQALEEKVNGTQVTIIDGGKEFHFVMADHFDNILDGALDAGADLPYACKGGVCSTCKCQVKEGAVKMKINYALDDKEVAQNYVLSCQAVPTTNKLVVDFDV